MGSWAPATAGERPRALVEGPYKEGYGLGTTGIDAHSETVWAVLDYAGDFAVAQPDTAGRQIE